MITLINNNSSNIQGLNNNQINIDINELKTDLENKRKLKQDIKEFIYQCTFSYFENFLSHTMFISKSLKV
jgi:predicted DNA binding CopG/RHH family protein